MLRSGYFTRMYGAFYISTGSMFTYSLHLKCTYSPYWIDDETVYLLYQGADLGEGGRGGHSPPFFMYFPAYHIERSRNVRFTVASPNESWQNILNQAKSNVRFFNTWSDDKYVNWSSHLRGTPIGFSGSVIWLISKPGSGILEEKGSEIRDGRVIWSYVAFISTLLSSSE